MKLLPLLAPVLALASPAFAQTLSKPEAAMVAAADKESDRTLGLLERMVNQNSGTLNLAGVRAVADMLRPEFEALGFKVEWLDMSETKRAGHLVATHMGNGRGKRMLLIAHLDTVFEPSSPFQTYRREGDKAYGPGILDDKGGIAVIVAALRAMHAAGTLKNADIKVMITGDEERGGNPEAIARRDLIEAGKWADVALEFENLAVEDGQEYGTIARRSSSGWSLTATGKTGHSGSVFSPHLGYGAIYEISRILTGWQTELQEEYLTFNVGVIAGGTPATISANGEKVEAEGKTNIIPSTAVARGDLRALTPEQQARARERMQAIVAKHLPGTSATVTFGDGKPPMSPTPGNRALLDRVNAINRDLGLKPMLEYSPSKRGAADSSYVAAYADTLAGMGAAGGSTHAEGEWLSIPSLALQAKRNAILMSRLAREKR